MMIANKAGKRIGRIFIRLIGIVLMLMIGIIQAVGIVLTAMSAVILKGISVLMIFVTVLLLIFGLFTWTRSLVVLLIAGSMFWIPEGMAFMTLGLSYVQAWLVNLMDAC